MTAWNDFNNADDTQAFDLIPKGTLVKVRMIIRPGGFDDPAQGWSGGYATLNDKTGAVYLNCEFVVLDGPYAKRKLWSLIGLYSPKGPEWANMGRSLIKGMLNSARGIAPQDASPAAQQARRIQGFTDLDGLEFVAKVDVEKDTAEEDKNVIKAALTPDHKRYAELMGVVTTSQTMPPTTPPVAQPTPAGIAGGGRPTWAQ